VIETPYRHAGKSHFGNGHNLDRCRTQFRLAELIEQHEEEMQKVVERLA
jgi:hypothetical protein